MNKNKSVLERMIPAEIKNDDFYIAIVRISYQRAQNLLFFPPPTFPGSGPTVKADFNGQLDLVSTDRTVLLGKGDGTSALTRSPQPGR